MPATPPRLPGRVASGRHSYSGCDRGLIRRLQSPLRHPGCCSSTMGPATQDKTGSALFPLLLCRHRPTGPASRWGRGSGDVTHPSEKGTQGPARRPAQSSQDQGRYPGRLRRPPPSHSALPTVSDHCTPAIRGKTTTSTSPLMCAAHPCDYKRRRLAFCRRRLGAGRLTLASLSENSQDD